MTKRSNYISVLRCIIVVLFISLIAGQSVSAGERVFMWKVDSPRATAYVLGTVHMMKKEMYPLDSRIENAFKKADA